MQELNQDSLRRSLAALPQREPPDAGWTFIEDRLAETSWPEMPLYDPPERIWGRIPRCLDQDHRRGLRISMGMRAAAVWAVLAFAIFLYRRLSTLLPDSDHITFS
ncbi:MAG: hypothetical protein RLY31_246 [Bacteroidota bacterium]|jgi:hypothetical protein